MSSRQHRQHPQNRLESVKHLLRSQHALQQLNRLLDTHPHQNFVPISNNNSRILRTSHRRCEADIPASGFEVSKGYFRYGLLVLVVDKETTHLKEEKRYSIADVLRSTSFVYDCLSGIGSAHVRGCVMKNSCFTVDIIIQTFPSNGCLVARVITGEVQFFHTSKHVSAVLETKKYKNVISIETLCSQNIPESQMCFQIHDMSITYCSKVAIPTYLQKDTVCIRQKSGHELELTGIII